MNDDDLTVLQQGVPAPSEPVLSPDRKQQLREHLMREITDTPAARPAAARRVRRLGWVALPALAGAVALGLVLTTGGGTPVSAAEVLDQAARAAAAKPAPQVRDDQFVYVKSQVAFASVAAGDGGDQRAEPDQLHQREIWLSVDGSRDPLLVEAGRPGLTPGKEDAGKKAALQNPARPAAGLNNPDYDYLAQLPTDPRTLLDKIYRETAGMGRTPDQEAFTTIGDALREQLAPPAVGAAFLRAAALIPGVTAVDHVTDALGRPGIAVTHVDQDVRTEWIFDPATHEFLGEREVLTKDQALGRAGTVIGQSAVQQRAVVDHAGDHPQG
jgi:hypothetical protein